MKVNTEMGVTWPRAEEAEDTDGPRSWTARARVLATVPGASGSCRHAGLSVLASGTARGFVSVTPCSLSHPVGGRVLLAATENWHVCEASSARVLVGTRGRGDAPFPGGARARRCHARSCCTGTAWQQVRPTGEQSPGQQSAPCGRGRGSRVTPRQECRGPGAVLGLPQPRTAGRRWGTGGGVVSTVPPGPESCGRGREVRLTLSCASSRWNRMAFVLVRLAGSPSPVSSHALRAS